MHRYLLYVPGTSWFFMRLKDREKVTVDESEKECIANYDVSHLFG